jgi:hypothetical protein
MRGGSDSRRVIIGALAGFLYGCVLAFLSLGAAGAGHGTQLPFLMSAAPLSAFDIVVAVFVAPPFWAAFGVLAALSSHGRTRTITQGLVLLHYASALAVVATYDDFWDVKFLLRVSPEFLVMWTIVYLAGQVALWWQLGRRGEPRPTA